MALTACMECGHQVSTEAATCPQCGAQLKAPKPKTAIWPWVLGVPVGLVVLVMVLGGTVLNTPEARAREQQRAVIELCTKDMNDPMRSAGHREAARAMCEGLRDRYVREHGREP